MRTLTVLLLVLVSFVIAETVTFQPDADVGKDTFVFNGNPDTNYGDATYTAWGRNNGSGVGRGNTYIEFVGLNESQYQGITVNSASLCWYLYHIDGNGDYGVGVCETSWNEDTITWRTMVGVIESFSKPFPTDTGWVVIDVTDYVQNWLDGTWDNYGFCLHDCLSFACTEAYSSDYTDDPTLRPKLILDYSGAAIEETTWGEIKASL